MEQNSNFDKDILVRLNILINLLLDTSEDNPSFASKIYKLSDMGISSSDIAKIINKPSKFVAATLSKRKGKKNE